MKKLDQFLHTLFWAAPGVFAGIALYEYIDFRTRPGLYAMQSAPWYVGLLPPGVGVSWLWRRPGCCAG